ncbi:glycosyl hydrolase family 18 protein [Bacillus sp. 2205SS5-2]|uniref:glycosyl hydrolase family 18 protein n=1 Tax=Bacillus sp. 2205SS5-2 TaxID=3109031 RepID=UPI0030055DEF
MNKQFLIIKLLFIGILIFPADSNGEQGFSKLPDREYWQDGKISKESLTLLIKNGKRATDTPVILGFYTKYYEDDEKSLNSLSNYYSYMNAVATATFEVNNMGEILGEIPTEGLALAKQHEVKRFATIQNGFDPDLAHTILASNEKSSMLIQELVKLTKENGYTGVNVDFEKMNPSDRLLYTEFIANLSLSLEKEQIDLMISVPAKTGDFPDNEWIGTFDYHELGKNADYIQLMTYDEHGTWGEPGPVAGVNWMTDVLDYAATHIDSEKLLLGIPSYGYDWNLTLGADHKAVSQAEVENLLLEKNLAVQWDDPSQSPYVHYQDEQEQIHVIWFENNQSISEKVHLVKKYKLAGISMWRMGLEQESFWQSIEETLEQFN